MPDLIPPAVEGAQVQHAVGGSFHAAGAAGLIRPQRRVQPHVDALHQVARDRHVVIFEEDDAPPELRIAADVRDLLDQFLARIVAADAPCRRR